MNFLKGNRTYLLVLLGMLVWGAQILGWVTPDNAVKLFEILGVGAAGTLRAALP
jgi:hypothetical protein